MVTHESHQVASKNDADTIVGVNVNEDCIALAAMSRNVSVKEQRHEFFTKRKRMQKAKQTAFETVMQTVEPDYVHDCLHKVSQFSSPVIVFEYLKICGSPSTTVRGLIVASTHSHFIPSERWWSTSLRGTGSRQMRLTQNTRASDARERSASTQNGGIETRSGSNASSASSKTIATERWRCA